MQSSKIKQYVAQHQQEYLDLLRNLVNLESHTYGKREVKDKCGMYLCSLFQELGFDVECIDAGETGIHLRGKLGNSTRKILLVGHYDTVFPIGTTKERPYSQDAEKAYGPGIYDMKGGLVSFYMAIRALKELDLLPKDREIDFFFNCDEEAGSPTSKAEIMALARQAEVCLVSEPGHDSPGYVTAGRFGRSVVTFTAKGEASHAGNRPDYAANPLVELSHLIIHLEALCDKDKGIWYSPVSLHGGDVGATAMTPATAQVIYDIRYRNEELGSEVERALAALTPVMDTVSIDISGGREKPPFVQGRTNEMLCLQAKKIIEELGCTYAPACLGGGSDANFTASVGCPSLCGLGPNGDFLHNEKEYILLKTIPTRVALVAELIRTL